MLFSPQPKPRIIFFDIDDTLFIKEQNLVPDSVAPALKALKSNGVITAIATGRSLGVMPRPVQTLIEDVGIDLLLTMNGQYNQYQGKKLIDFPLSSHQVKTISQIFFEQKIAHACMTKDEIFTFDDTKNLRQALGDLGIIPTRVDRQTFDFNQTIYQILAFYQEQDQIQVELPQDIKTTRWHPCAVDVLDQQASKARAIKQVLDHLKIKPEQSAAFGDGLNDLEMFRLVGIAIAMGNAQAHTKAQADFVTKSHQDHGIAHALEQLGWI